MPHSLTGLLNVACFLVAVYRWQTLNDSKQEFPFLKHFGVPFHVKQPVSPSQEMQRGYQEFRGTLSNEEFCRVFGLPCVSRETPDKLQVNEANPSLVEKR